MARPKIEIDESLVIRMAEIHCTMIEIASVVKCSVDTLERRFADVIHAARERGKSSLRRKMWAMALDDNQRASERMLIWLSKQHLGMKEPSVAQIPASMEKDGEKLIINFGQPIEPGDAK